MNKVLGKNLVIYDGRVDVSLREKLFGHKQLTIWLTGLSASGKSTLAFLVEEMLIKLGYACFVLDGDNIRHGLNSDLNFSLDDRSENIRRSAEVAKIMNNAGLIVIAAFISPLKVDREIARSIVGVDKFHEVYLDTDIKICQIRDPKGFYKKAEARQISDFTGISSPYDIPENPDLIINAGADGQSDCAKKLLDFILCRV